MNNCLAKCKTHQYSPHSNRLQNLLKSSNQNDKCIGRASSYQLLDRSQSSIGALSILSTCTVGSVFIK